MPPHALLVSTTDLQGRITHCNRAFVEVSGYSYEELLGEPHNLVRHPDMPPEAFKDLWATVGRGRPWTGIVKNRRKDGDHYWVRAHVTPVLDEGKPAGYMSVREPASAEEVRGAEELYAQMREGRARVRLHAGRLRGRGLGELVARVHRLSLSQRLSAGLLVLLLTGLWAQPLGLWVLGGVQLGVALALLAWFRISIQNRLDEAEEAAMRLASCNLRGVLEPVHPHPLSGLTRALGQIQVNLRAVIGDAREEVRGTISTTDALARGGQDLSSRTEVQAGAVQKTAASMEQIAGTVHQTAGTAQQVAQQGERAAATAHESGQAVALVDEAFRAIEDSSRRVADIVQVIEGIAFQTNILALNAAVEAARAGEQGRGFAVVAGEVRTLAQRSAGAAKEVRALIEASTRSVADSARRMGGVHSAIASAVDEVGRMGSMIREITAATTEQSSGIAEVNQAVAELDRMTQANADMVVQTTAAVEALSRRTETLDRSLQVFRT
ncbi:methyl-accepting chemotaxis protein [Pelomonas sp. CA6]|uniref:methyl-accepting chemotaxis protein n=1 Tax=Pelomonas sp. CA6 TaxID=2907999 RepID=UPI0027E05815|nr:methyl-accepting chemotaxis protein [Pelomonas sp. CA6]